MPVSLVHLDTLNMDPLPPDSWAEALWGVGSTVAYGFDAADGGGLDSADFTGSYIQIGRPNPTDPIPTARVVTARLTADPPIPASAVGTNLGGPEWSYVQMQGRGLIQPITGDSATPYFLAFSSTDITQAPFAWAPPIDFATDGRWITEADVGPSLFNGYIVNNAQLVDLIKSGGYVVISPGNQRGDVGIDLSQIIAAVAWLDDGVKWHKVGGHSGNPTGGPNLKILTPGVGWVEVIDGPA